MQVTIVGAGAIALGYAAYLIQNGHKPKVWSPSGARLDQETLTIAAAFGKSVRTTFDHCRLSFGVVGDSFSAISEQLVRQGSDPPGPRDIATRYVLEEVPFGLVPTLRPAELAGVRAPLHEGGVAILGTCYGRYFVADNDILPEIGPLQIDTLKRLVVDGYAVPT
ncbi:hypothetical protein HDG34_005085 [Paraburkholderia sp. HC6.4b]|uniref:NAD/NADP octopine/nopaline dehydrogenase family protein n=1 Tax=unclassified Paraburkholderia TaxID=2615204 RepID=UPI00160E5344|nr:MULTISPECIES: NAD/NADP octopine/nopaline dehydrogenase family protein [unclassified Paraburkholderia]MBB5411125.1 hypothetical protein [Paraburkholderia sp. HC6.4b]MBB5453897.1 hypothetical protein [Paraburkholderia sp. Kb1A]